MLHMPERGIEKKGVVVVSDYLFYCLINGTAHQLVVIAVAELAYNETAQVRQHATHAQVADHPIDVIMPAVKAAIPLVEIEGGKLTIADLDLMTDIMAELNFTEALQLIWAIAANGDKSINNPEVWYGEFDFFPLDEVLTEIGPALLESCLSSKKFKALSQKLRKAVPKTSA